MNENTVQRRVIDFIEDVLQDVDVRDKQWFIPAIVSHCVCSLGIRREVVEPIVNTWMEHSMMEHLRIQSLERA
ncbi:hypothetical protein LCGC14_2932100 [marine sediment metagenome]|uniref:Uncharacterized protein n=1 Tax=marine sediment metagenome TaxID=412755 RepID=A0A0F8XL20_9ZZZZ